MKSAKYVAEKPCCAQFSSYPPAVQKTLWKIEQALKIGIFASHITKTVRAVAIEIFSRLNVKNPKQPLRIRNDRIALALGISTKSVQRAIKALEELGLIALSTEHDGRNARGRFSYREFVVQDEAIALFSLSPVQQSNPDLVGIPEDLHSLVLHTGIARNTIISLMSLALKHKTTVQAAIARARKRLTADVGPGLVVTIIRDVIQSKKSASKKMSNGQIVEKPRLVAIEKSTKMSDGHKDDLINRPKQTMNKALKASHVDQSEEMQQFSTEFGVYPGALATLSIKAAQKKVSLLEVIRAKKESMAKLHITQGRAVAYLQKLINTDTDWRTYNPEFKFPGELDSPKKDSYDAMAKMLFPALAAAPKAVCQTATRCLKEVSESLKKWAGDSRYIGVFMAKDGRKLTIEESEYESNPIIYRVDTQQPVRIIGDSLLSKICRDIDNGVLVRV